MPTESEAVAIAAAALDRCRSLAAEFFAEFVPSPFSFAEARDVLWRSIRQHIAALDADDPRQAETFEAADAALFNEVIRSLRPDAEIAFHLPPPPAPAEVDGLDYYARLAEARRKGTTDAR